METYKDMLQSPKWQKKRLEVFDQKGFKCEQCGEKDEQLAIHHKYYKKNHKPWEYEDDAYMVLCKSCHEKVHNAKKIILTMEEAELIKLIRENLNETDLVGLINTIKEYRDEKYGTFWPYLYKLLTNDELYNLMINYLQTLEEHNQVLSHNNYLIKVLKKG